MRSRELVFEAPYAVSLRNVELGEPGPGDALCETLASAISSGTELLAWKGSIPMDMHMEEGTNEIESLNGGFSYPSEFGYSVVARPVAVGSGVDRDIIGRRFFAFRPHASAFLCRADELIAVPEGVVTEDAVFFASAETAVNLVHDCNPRYGEDGAVFGLGTVGLLSSALFSRFPLARLTAYEPLAARRAAASAAGIAVADPSSSPPLEASLDFALELSGDPAALGVILPAMRFSGTIVVGSWYGDKRSSLELGSWFHRGRLRLVSSQVSSVAPELSGRWTKRRRYEAAWKAIREIGPSRWISHRFPVEESSHAYELLCENAGACLQVILLY